MGRSSAKPERPPTQDHNKPLPQQIAVDANKVIARLQQQRADNQATIDLLQVAYEDSQEQIQNLLARIAELEDGIEKKDD